MFIAGVAQLVPACRQAGSNGWFWERAMSFYVYAVRSLKDQGLYIGISADPNRRLKDHNRGMTKSIRGRKPFKLVYRERCCDRVDARRREKELKSGYGREFLKKFV